MIPREPITSIPKERECSLSFAQARLWFLDQLEPDSNFYDIPAHYRLIGLLNITVLEQSLNEIVLRHEVLRTTFPSVDGQPIQAITQNIALTLPIIDLQKHPETEKEAISQQIATEEAQQPFALATGPLFRAQLLRLSDQEHLLLLNFHHIIFDGWSFNIFFQELTALYTAFSTDQPSPLPKLPVQYADFAHWQREWLQGEVLESQLNYWKQQLGGNLPILQLPTDYPRPPVQTYPGAYQSLELSLELTKALKTISQQESVTLFMTLLAAFQTLLYRYSGQEDIIVGTSIAGRNQVETEELIGFFVNTLALRTDLSGNPNFRQLLSRVRAVTLGAYDHQDLPLEKLIEELNPERDLSRSPLFQVMFAFQNTPSQPWELPGLTITPLEVHSGTSKFDLTLDLRETSEGIKGGIEYNTDLFEAATITRMLAHFQVLLEGIVANPEQCLSDLPLLTPAEQHPLQDQALTVDELRRFLQQKLPSYMIPSAFIFLDALPLTPNGKIDRHALPEPDETRLEQQGTFVAPRDELELQLTQIWEKVLGIQPIGIKDNFFDLGGHSLLAVRLAAEIEKEFGKKFLLATLFQTPTIEQIADILCEKDNQNGLLKQKGNPSPLDILVPIKPTGSKQPLFFVHDADGETMLYLNLARHLDTERPIYGLQPHGQEGYPILHTRITEMANNYIEKMRTVQPEGPYLLGGLCAGGIIAFEIACQLQVQGHKVGLVALIDAADVQAPYKKGRISHQRLSRFSQALSQEQQIKGLNLPFYLLKTVIKKTKNLIIYEVKTKIKNLQNKFKIKLYRHYLDNSFPLPKFLQNISVRTIISFAYQEYVPQVYQDRVVLFRATKSLGIEDSSIDDTPTIEKTSDPLFGWGERAMGGVEVYDIPGGHSSCLQEPYVQVLAAKMEAYIKDALSGESSPSTVMAEKKSTKENLDV